MGLILVSMLTEWVEAKATAEIGRILKAKAISVMKTRLLNLTSFIVLSPYRMDFGWMC
jgi:hypothetical protein